MPEISDVSLLEYIVKSVTTHPADVLVTRSVDEMGVLLSLTLHPEDMSFVIGKAGINSLSIRNVLKMYGAKHNARINVKINEPVRI